MLLGDTTTATNSFMDGIEALEGAQRSLSGLIQEVMGL